MAEPKCFACGSENDLYCLAKRKSGNDQYQCLKCNRERTKRYYDKCKRLVLEYYGAICICCGENQILFLTIDHVNNDGNTERWSNGTRITGVHLYQKIVKASFPDSYQVLCMNCNFGKHANGGICPHVTIKI